MSRLIPLGFIGGGKKPFTFDTTVGGFSVYNYGGAYAPLSNAKWFVFRATNANADTTGYYYTNDANPSSGWTSGTLPAAKKWGQAVSSGTRLVVAETGGADTTGAYSDNGTTWTSTTIWSSSQATVKIIHDGTRFVAHGDAGQIATSSAGSSWFRLSPGGGKDLAYDGAGTYIIIDGGTNNKICTGSPFTIGDWTTFTGLNGTNVEALAYGNGLWVAVKNLSGGTTYYTSPDGTTWTSRTLPAATSSNADFTKITFANGYFYYQSSSTAIYSSPNGITWTIQTTPTIGTPVRAWPTDGNYALAIGGNSATIAIGRK
jgi:hypothetical protein